MNDPSQPRPRSYLALALLAGGALPWVLHLSAGDRGLVDWAVIAFAVGALLYNLVRLSQRLHAVGGMRAAWHVQRTALFWLIGLLNTVYARPEDADTWRRPLGWVLLAVAALDTVALAVRERTVLRDAPAGAE